MKTDHRVQVSVALSGGSTDSHQALHAHQHLEAGASVTVAQLQEEKSSQSKSKINLLKLSENPTSVLSRTLPPTLSHVLCVTSCFETCL